MEGNASSLPDGIGSAEGLPSLTPAARSLTEHLRAIIGPSVVGIIHYGSRAQGRATRSDSAYDFLVVVESNRQAYRSLAAALGDSFPTRTAIALAWWLPPNAVAVRHRLPAGEREAKCMIICVRHFRRECSARARDQFVGVRLAQHVHLAWSRDRESADAMGRCLLEARRRAFDWVRVFLPPRFDTARYCRTMLEVSFANEIRAEAGDHAAALFTAQREELLRIHGPILESLVDQGLLARDAGEYRQVHRPGALHRLRVGAFLRVSKLRTTLRLLKHPLLYDRWLDYLVNKIQRSTGEVIELSDRERRWPLVFLWPRAYRYLRSRPQTQR